MGLFLKSKTASRCGFKSGGLITLEVYIFLGSLTYIFHLLIRKYLLLALDGCVALVQGP